MTKFSLVGAEMFMPIMCISYGARQKLERENNYFILYYMSYYI